MSIREKLKSPIGAMDLMIRSMGQLAWYVRSFWHPVDLVLAVSSMFRWHVLGWRQSDSRRVWDFRLRSGRRFRVRLWTSDFEVMRKVLLGDQYSIVVARLPTDALVLDLGANIGASARLILESRPDARVIAVEPDGGNTELLAFNMRDFPERCTIEAAAVAGEAGFVLMERADQPWAHRVREVDKQAARCTEAISAWSIPDLLERANLPGAVIDLVKCDIEGAEVALFKHPLANQWLQRTRWLSVELHGGYSPEEFLQDLKSHGCQASIIEEHRHGPDSELTLQLSALTA